MSELEAKRRNRRESHQLADGVANLTTTETKQKVTIDNNYNSRNIANTVKNENDSPRKEKGINDKEDAEKSRNKVDKEGDAVMVVWKEEQPNTNKNNNRESGLFNLEVNSKTEANDEPVSPSPRVGGKYSLLIGCH